MHRCLEIPDVLDAIISHLPAAPMEESPEARDFAAIRRRALASLACASRNFEEPALNALWRFQETIMNLLNLMPAGLWERLDGAMRPTRRLVQEDLKRLEHYSHRVKHLELWEQGPTFIHVFGALRLVLPANSALLPNLHFLLWTYSDGATYPFIDLFLGPELKALIFGGAQGCNAHYALLAKLEQSITPTLWTFCLDPPAPGSTPPPTNWVSNFARRMTHIKVFLVGAPINLSALIHLGGLETLHTFRATLPTSISIPEPPKGTLFSNMREVTLGIESGGIPAATEFVRTWNIPPVESFNGNYSGCIVPQHLEDFHGVLGTHCRLDTLKEFNLCLWDQSPGCLYPGHLLTSLILFHNLTVLYISAYEGYEITDEIVSSLARAWPQLEEFHLASVVQSRHPPRATLLAIRALAQHCPNLRALEMTFDAINVPPNAPLAIRQRSLPQLDVVFSPITEPRPVGQFLSGIFAELREITTQDFSTAMLWANATMFASSFGNPQPTPWSDQEEKEKEVVYL